MHEWDKVGYIVIASETVGTHIYGLNYSNVSPWTSRFMVAVPKSSDYFIVHNVGMR
jgi:hypothetical protein